MKTPFGYTLNDYVEDDSNIKNQHLDNGVLINNFNATDTQTLNKLERYYSDLRTSQLIINNYIIEFSIESYKNIHKHIFQDVYPWAGDFRLIDTMKGDSLFIPHQKIHNDLEHSLKKLENFLNAPISKDYLENGLGTFLGEVNRIHPFSEGNGRTQRVFLNSLMHDKEYAIDWKTISNDRMKMASIEAHHNNLTPMISLIRNSLIINKSKDYLGTNLDLLQPNQKAAIETYRKAIHETFKNNPQLLIQKLDALDKRLAEIDLSTIELPDPPVERNQGKDKER